MICYCTVTCCKINQKVAKVHCDCIENYRFADTCYRIAGSLVFPHILSKRNKIPKIKRKLDKSRGFDFAKNIVAASL